MNKCNVQMCCHTKLLVSSTGAINEALQATGHSLFFFFYLSYPTLQIFSMPLSLSAPHMHSESRKLHTWTIKAGVNQFNALQNSHTFVQKLHLLPEQRNSSKEGFSMMLTARCRSMRLQLSCSTCRFFIHVTWSMLRPPRCEPLRRRLIPCLISFWTTSPVVFCRCFFFFSWKCEANHVKLVLVPKL